MTKADKKIWVKALRSGKYKQGLENLHYQGRFCCLGVAVECNLTKPCDSQDEYVSKTFLSRKIQEKLAAMNDGTPMNSPKSFNEIADWIEKNL